jgi:hypothetical protein
MTIVILSHGVSFMVVATLSNWCAHSCMCMCVGGRQVTQRAARVGRRADQMDWSAPPPKPQHALSTVTRVPGMPDADKAAAERLRAALTGLWVGWGQAGVLVANHGGRVDGWVGGRGGGWHVQLIGCFFQVQPHPSRPFTLVGQQRWRGSMYPFSQY